MTSGPTVADALAEFRRAHGLPHDEAARASWTCRLGPLTVRLPNWRWRRRAILAHDLHHLLTGIPCTLRGECQMAAWEFAAGPMPHWGARLFCLPLVLLGLLWSPRRIWRAYLAGQRSPTLHETGVTNSLLASPLRTVRRTFRAPGHAPATTADRWRFAALLAEAAVIVLAPITILLVCWISLTAT